MTDRIAFYSYKGGAGRSTAAANVAAGMMKLGANVLLVDFDFEGGALHTILGSPGGAVFDCPDADHNSDYPHARGLGFVLNRLSEDDEHPEVVIDWYLNACLDDIKQRLVASAPALTSTERASVRDCQGSLYFLPTVSRDGLPALLASRKLRPTANEIMRFARLWDTIERRTTHFVNQHLKRSDYRFDYVIFDSASGIAIETRPAVSISQKLCCFYRMSGQHVEGLEQLVRRLWERWRYPSKRLIAVEVCWPEIQGIRPGIVGLVRDHRGSLEARVDAINPVNDRLRVHWDDSLASLERILVFEPPSPVAADYERLARTLMDV